MPVGLATSVLLPIVGVLRWPIIERIPLFGDFAISPHGIGAAAGFLVGAKLMLRRAELRGLGYNYVPNIREAVQDLLVRAAIGALVGSRLFYVLTHLDIYVRDPVRIFFLWEGGLTFLGGVAGAILAALPEARRRDYRLWQLLDSAAPGLAVGIAIGRIGDLAIGDHIGELAPDFPLAWRCTANFWHSATNSLSFTNPVPAQPYPFGPMEAPTQGCYAVPVHQTALYDFLQAALLVVLLLLLERRPRWDGFFAAAYVYWYGAFRLGIDFLRQDRRLFGLTGSQYASLTAIVALTVFLRWSKPWQRRPWTWTPPDFDRPWLHPPEQTVSARSEGERQEASQPPGPRTGR